jgi:mRNA interferase MazF
MPTSRTAYGRVVLKLSQRDIILIPFPFSDLTGSKVRPALVISNDGYNGIYLDAIVVALTSNLTHSQYKILITHSDLERGRLPVDSAVRCDKPFSVLQSKTLKVQARLTEEKFKAVQQAIATLLQ